MGFNLKLTFRGKPLPEPVVHGDEKCWMLQYPVGTPIPRDYRTWDKQVKPHGYAIAMARAMFVKEWGDCVVVWAVRLRP